MYVHRYIRKYTHTRAHACTCTCIYTHVHVLMYVHTHAHPNVYALIMCACLRVHLRLCQTASRPFLPLNIYYATDWCKNTCCRKVAVLRTHFLAHVQSAFRRVRDCVTQ